MTQWHIDIEHINYLSSWAGSWNRMTWCRTEYRSYAFFENPSHSFFISTFCTSLRVRICVCVRTFLRLFTMHVWLFGSLGGGCRVVAHIHSTYSHIFPIPTSYIHAHVLRTYVLEMDWNVLHQYMLDLLLFAIVVAVFVVLITSLRHTCTANKICM